MSPNDKKLQDYRILFRRANLQVGEVSLHTLTSRLDFRLLESALAVQVGGVFGDVEINGFPLPTDHPLPVPLSASELVLNVLNAGPAVLIFSPIKSHCKTCVSKGRE